MMQVVRRFRDKDIAAILNRVKAVGALLTQAQPREIAVGNIVRRVLGVIREEAEEERDAADGNFSEATSESGTGTPWDQSTSPLHSGDLSIALGTDPGIQALTTDHGLRPSLMQSSTSFQPSGSVASMFDLLSVSQTTTPGTQTPHSHRGSPRPGPVGSSMLGAHKDIKGEVLQGIEEIIDELTEVDDQIAAYALEHIHSAETILVHGASTTVQKFLLRAAAKREFTVIHCEAYPNGHHETYRAVTGKRARPADSNQADAEADEDEDALDSASFTKPLIAAGITVILIPDAALFALMARVNKVLLGTHVVLANGGLVAAAGVRAVAQAARAHRVPVIVASGVYKLSPLYPFDFEALIEHGDACNVVPFQLGDLVHNVDVLNPLFDYVPPELVDLYVTNL
jgi:translation initiation factor eIF-2B subunit beta